MITITEYMTKSIEIRKKHLDLVSPCIERGGNSTQFRGLLAYYLDTTIPAGFQALCCHACNNQDCSNPKHLYWGTSKENVNDMFLFHGEEFKSRLRKKLYEINPTIGCKPWRTNNGNISSWKLANRIYLENLNKDWSKYGSGPSFLVKKYNIASGSAKTMIKLFRKGWIPNQDPEWIKDFSTD